MAIRRSLGEAGRDVLVGVDAFRELRFDDFADGVTWEVVDQQHAFRHLVRRDALLALTTDAFLVERRALLRNHDCHRDFSPGFVGHADHGHVRDAGDVTQDFFDFERAQLVARRPSPAPL